MVEAGHHHALELRFILGCHHREVRHTAQIADVVLALVGRTIGANDASAVQNKGDRQVLNADVVDQLVVSALQEGAVDRADRTETFTGHARGHRHRVLFSDADVEILLGTRLLEHVQTGTGGHSRRNTHHPGVLFAELDQSLAKHLAVTGGLRLARGVGLAGGQIEGALGVIAHLVFLGEGIALALGRGHMDQNRALMGVGLLEDLDQPADVMAIDRPHIGEAQLFKDRTQLGNGKPLHALFEVLELGRELAVHERQMLDRLFGVVLKELERAAVPHPVQVGG